MALGDTLRDLQLEDWKGIISHVNECTYLRVRISKDGNYEPEINPYPANVENMASS
jgi:hypothetical protein